MTIKTLSIALLGAALATSATYGGEMIDAMTTAGITTGAVKTKAAKGDRVVPIYNYNSRISQDGKVIVELDEETSAPANKARDVMTVFAPNVKTTEKLLHSQDWYITVDPNGGITGIYTMPANLVLPSNALRSLNDGSAIMKVNPRTSFFKVFPSQAEIAAQLATMSQAARKSICGQDNKPEQLTADLDVKPGWSAAGRIRFSATWKTEELCSKKAS